MPDVEIVLSISSEHVGMAPRENLDAGRASEAPFKDTTRETAQESKPKRCTQ
jgi:hypothetical protein